MASIVPALPLILKKCWAQQLDNSSNPKHSHEIALKRIGRYLKGKKEDGLILNPSLEDGLGIDMHVDEECTTNSRNTTKNKGMKISDPAMATVAARCAPFRNKGQGEEDDPVKRVAATFQRQHALQRLS